MRKIGKKRKEKSRTYLKYQKTRHFNNDGYATLFFLKKRVST